MGRQMDHRLAHGRFESRNVSTCNCSTIRSPWAESCYKRTLPCCFSRIFPIPCGTQVSLVPGRCSWHIQPVPRLRADACSGMQSGSRPLHGSIKVLPEHMAALCSISMLLPAETWAGKRQCLSDFPSITQLGSSWASLTQGIRSASGFTSLDRPQACSTEIVWFDHESHPSLGSKHTSHALPLFASHIEVLSTASIWSFLTFQK